MKQMKLWLLNPSDDLKFPNDPWCPSYGKIHATVVRAESENDARNVAALNGERENKHPLGSPWLRPDFSTCEEIKSDGEPMVIMSYYVD